MAEALLSVAGDLVLELYPRRQRTLRIALKSRLDRDLGMDSLGRAELLFRLERQFKVRLPEGLLGEAETLDDLLAALMKAHAGDRLPASRTIRRPVEATIEEVPAEALTLLEVLDWHAERHADRPHILLTGESEGDRTITYRDLAQAARRVAHGLRRRGLEPGETVAIMLPTGEAFFQAFLGILYAGGVPVPIYPPMRASQIEEHLNRQALILRNCRAVLLITVPEARAAATLLRVQVESLRIVESVPGLSEGKEEKLPGTPQSTDLALLQYTSGSTGDPKGVMLSHANLLHNIRAMGLAMEASSSDVFVSWLPLYHDMGLIGAWLGSLYYAAPVVIMSPLSFLIRPEAWLWAIHRYRGTLSASPNFGFELCVRRIDDKAVEGLDLGSLRMVANGAEPVSPLTIRRFTERFKKYGFRPEAMAPVYGLAENSVGLAFPPPSRPPLFERIQRQALSLKGEARPASAEDRNAIELVSCGSPLPGHQIRIVDPGGRELGERREGRLQFCGPSATTGYYRNQAKTRALFDGKWLDSADLAYIAGGEVFITGRVKDIIFRAGRNIYPQEVEEAVGEIAGVRKGCVAVFGSPDTASGTERLIVLAETRETDSDRLEDLRRRILTVTTDILELPPDEVILRPPHTAPKTSSGKIRRAAARALFEAGKLDAPSRALWLQVARLTLAGALPQTRRLLAALSALLYAAYWWSVVGVLGAAVWSLVILLPRRRWRWALLRRAARMALWLMGTPLRVEGEPRAEAILVSNHASYLDGLVLTASLPRELTFVAKKELAGQLVAGPFLRRLGTLFIERRGSEDGLAETRQALAAAPDSQSLVFFPEGTLTRMPGLLSFHPGAFLLAAESGLAVQPVTIRGTRSVLRGEQWFPRRGRLEVILGKPLRAEGRDFSAAIGLRDAVRAQILQDCGEPDLAQERIIFSARGIERVDLPG
jgi:1-acyl-sn-glycerol-3-phosphate acyltransferase